MLNLEKIRSNILYPLPKIGMRNQKSAFAVVICFVVWQVIRLANPNIELHPLYAYVSVVLTMRDTPENSNIYGKIRVKLTIIGLSVALVFISVSYEIQSYLSNEYLEIVVELIIIALGIIFSLYLSYVLKCDNLCAISAVVFLVCMIRDNSENVYIYALLRTLETILGIGISLLVNKYFLPLKKEKPGDDDVYLMGVDVGTSAIKAAVFDENGEQIASSTVDYTLNTKGKFVEFDAEQYWVLFQKGMNEVAGNLTISALSIDTQCETLILTDEYGNPTRNAIVWLDNRATEEAKEIENMFGVQNVYEITGQPEITATWPACKLLWVKKNEPETWAKTKKIFLLEDYLLYKLTGEFVTEKTLQSSSLYFNIRKGTWWTEMLDFIGVSEDMLPEIHNSGEVVGKSGDMSIVTGAIDQIAGAIGAGIINNSVVSEMTGTTMVIFVPSDEIPPYNANSKVPCHVNYDGKYCLMSWTPTAGIALKWFKNNFCEHFSFQELDELANKVMAGSDGLTFLPYLCGSIMPKYNPEAKGAFYGFTLEHTRGHAVRSILESVACMLKSNIDYLGLDCDEIRSMGGGSSSPLWCQIKADLTGKRIVTLKNSETACLGSAILAGVGIGVYSSVENACERLIKMDKVYKPSGADYTKAYKRFCDLEAKTI